MATPANECRTCRGLGVVLHGGIVDACTVCDRFGTGRSIAKGRAEAMVAWVLRAAANARDVLWPAGDPNAEWSAETIEDVARALDFLRPAEAEGTGAEPEAPAELWYCATCEERHPRGKGACSDPDDTTSSKD